MSTRTRAQAPQPKPKQAPYKAATYPKTPLPSAYDRFALSRFSAGWTPALQRDVDAAGGFTAWFDRQITAPANDSWARDTFAWWPSLANDAPTLAQRQKDGIEPMWMVMLDYLRWNLVRRLATPNQVLDVVTDMWENHLHVPVNGEGWATYRVPYGLMLRERALGRYADLLYAAITHPAMGIYLSNAGSTKTHPNENLGRELLELHTVGHDSGDGRNAGAPPYTEAEVIDSARILTGWRVDAWRTWKASYIPADHYTGPVSVLGFTDPNSNPDGRDLTRRYLDHLARHPLTARRIARLIAVRFVSDTPSNALIDRLAQTYLAADTSIAAVLKTLVRDPDFLRAAKASATKKTGTQDAPSKVRTPDEDTLATWRALGAQILKPRTERSAAVAILWQCGDIGALPYTWPRPDGRPDTAEAWSTSSRFLGSLAVHYNLAGGWWPRDDAIHRPYASWLPESSMRYDAFVDHLSRCLLGRPSTDLLLRACCEVLGLAPGYTVTADSNLIRYDLPRVLTTVLDTTAHMSR